MINQPKHSVAKKMNDNWLKIAGVLIKKLGGDDCKEVVVTNEDIQKIVDMTVLADSRDGNLIILVLNDAEAIEMITNQQNKKGN
jgi:hypothetical protein